MKNRTIIRLQSINTLATAVIDSPSSIKARDRFDNEVQITQLNDEALFCIHIDQAEIGVIAIKANSVNHPYVIHAWCTSDYCGMNGIRDWLSVSFPPSGGNLKSFPNTETVYVYQYGNAQYEPASGVRHYSRVVYSGINYLGFTTSVTQAEAALFLSRSICNNNGSNVTTTITSATKYTDDNGEQGVFLLSSSDLKIQFAICRVQTAHASALTITDCFGEAIATDAVEFVISRDYLYTAGFRYKMKPVLFKGSIALTVNSTPQLVFKQSENSYVSNGATSLTYNTTGNKTTNMRVVLWVLTPGNYGVGLRQCYTLPGLALYATSEYAQSDSFKYDECVLVFDEKHIFIRNNRSSIVYKDSGTFFAGSVGSFDSNISAKNTLMFYSSTGSNSWNRASTFAEYRYLTDTSGSTAPFRSTSMKYHNNMTSRTNEQIELAPVKNVAVEAANGFCSEFTAFDVVKKLDLSVPKRLREAPSLPSASSLYTFMDMPVCRILPV